MGAVHKEFNLGWWATHTHTKTHNWKEMKDFQFKQRSCIHESSL